MNKIQAMYDRGVRAKDIAAELGISISAVYAHLSPIRPPRQPMRCPRSDSCFTCPLPDCSIRSAFRYNELETDYMYLRN